MEENKPQLLTAGVKGRGAGHAVCWLTLYTDVD